MTSLDRRPGSGPLPGDRPSVRSGGVAEFLSDAWIEDLARAARAIPGVASLQGAPPLVVEQRIRGRDGEAVYSIRFDGDGARVVKGATDSADLVVRTDAGTALAIQRGTMSAQEATTSGRLKVRGRIERLPALAEALSRLDDVFRDVRNATSEPMAAPGPPAET